MAIKTASDIRLTSIPPRTAFKGDCPSLKRMPKAKLAPEKKSEEKKK